MSAPPAPTAYLLSLGEELLEGRVQDLNASTFATELLRRGYHVVGMRTLGDGDGELTAVLEELDGGVDLILSTGGLGPTVDDRVRAETAAFLGRRLQSISPAAEADLEGLYRRHHDTPPPPFFMAQGMIPEGMQALANAAGTAWGFAGELPRGSFYAALPGPPRECGSTFHQGGLTELLEERFDADGEGLSYALVHTVGAPESVVESRIRDLLEAGGNPRLGITAGAGKVSISVLARAEPGDPAQAVRDRTVDLLRERLGELVFGDGGDSLASVVVEALKERGQELCMAESCTGGRLAAAITGVPGASAVFRSGYVTYADEVKASLLAVPEPLLAAHGAVSEEVAAAMAAGARERSGADWAVAITGIAGPGGGSAEKPVGLVWFALAGPDGLAWTVCRRQYARGGREVVQELSVRDALDLLRRALEGHPPLPSTG